MFFISQIGKNVYMYPCEENWLTFHKNGFWSSKATTKRDDQWIKFAVLSHRKKILTNLAKDRKTISKNNHRRAQRKWNCQKYVLRSHYSKKKKKSIPRTDYIFQQKKTEILIKCGLRAYGQMSQDFAHRVMLWNLVLEDQLNN